MVIFHVWHRFSFISHLQRQGRIWGARRLARNRFSWHFQQTGLTHPEWQTQGACWCSMKRFRMWLLHWPWCGRLHLLAWWMIGMLQQLIHLASFCSVSISPKASDSVPLFTVAIVCMENWTNSTYSYCVSRRLHDHLTTQELSWGFRVAKFECIQDPLRVLHSFFLLVSIFHDLLHQWRATCFAELGY